MMSPNLSPPPYHKGQIIGPIDDHTFTALKDDYEAALNNNQNVFPIEINSPGGYVSALLSMADLLSSSPMKICTVCLGEASSAASVVLALGSPGYRFVYPSSTVMVHDVSYGAWGSFSEVELVADRVAIIRNKLFELLDAHTKKKKGHWMRKCGKNNLDLYFNSEEAVKEGLADFISVPKFHANPLTYIDISY